MSNNWIVENIQNALDTWNDKLNEIWRLLSQSPPAPYRITTAGFQELPSEPDLHLSMYPALQMSV